MCLSHIYEEKFTDKTSLNFSNYNTSIKSALHKNNKLRRYLLKEKKERTVTEETKKSYESVNASFKTLLCQNIFSFC